MMGGVTRTGRHRMPPDRPAATTHDEHEAVPNGDPSCEICGSTDSLTSYSIGSPSGPESSVFLCRRHYRVAMFLDGDQMRETNRETDSDLQETRKITVRVPRALIESADAAAEQQGQTRSEFVREGIQLAIELETMDDAFAEILSRAVHSSSETTQPDTDSTADTDVEFLKERIRTLESLLEDSIEKL